MQNLCEIAWNYRKSMWNYCKTMWNYRKSMWSCVKYFSPFYLLKKFCFKVSGSLFVSKEKFIKRLLVWEFGNKFLLNLWHDLLNLISFLVKIFCKKGEIMFLTSQKFTLFLQTFTSFLQNFTFSSHSFTSFLQDFTVIFKF